MKFEVEVSWTEHWSRTADLTVDEDDLRGELGLDYDDVPVITNAHLQTYLQQTYTHPDGGWCRDVGNMDLANADYQDSDVDEVKVTALPEGYRWADEAETEALMAHVPHHAPESFRRKIAGERGDNQFLLVHRVADSGGIAYVEDEADLAVLDTTPAVTTVAVNPELL